MSDYTTLIGLVQITAAIVLFFIVNWIGKNSISVGYIQLSTSIAEDSYPAFNFLFKVIAPPVYLVIYATICQTVNLEYLNNHCYLLVIYYWLFRALFVIVTGKGRLTNWVTYIIYTICSVGISYWIYTIINDVDRILPEPKDLLNQLWLLIIIFLYGIINKLEFGRKRTIRRKESYINHKYKKFNGKYGETVRNNCKNDFLEAITFSIMIYENFNRPTVVRWIENLRFWVTKKEHTLGIMQVKTGTYITNQESIKLAIIYIKESIINMHSDLYVNSDYSHSDMASAIAMEYNGGSPGYINEVQDIYYFLNENYYPNAENDYEKFIQNNK